MITSTLFAILLTFQSAAAVSPGAETLGQAYFLFLQGRVLEGQGDTAGAIATYRKAIAIAPKAGEIRAELASLYARENRVNEAVTEAEAALGIEPDNRQAHRILGFIQAALAERPGPGTSADAMITQAIDHFERALAGGVRDPGAELTLGRLYVQAGRHDQAIATLRSFLLAQPGYPEGLMLLAEAYDGAGQIDLAAAQLAEVIRVDADQLRARAWLAELYERSGRWKDAVATWAGLVQLGPRARSYRTRYATALVNAGEVDAGRKELVGITKDSPRDVSAWYLLSQVERRAGNAVGAEEAARRITELDADDPRGPLALSEARSARGDFRGAAAALEPRVTAAREDDVRNGTYARMAASLAGALEQLREGSRAVTVLETAGRRDPSDVDLQFELAATYERNARPDDAERVFRALIAKDPKHADALNYLGYMLAERGRQLDEAIDLVKRALAIEADNPSYLDSLGWAYFKRGTLDSARDPLERAAAARPRNSVIQDHLGELYFQLKRYRDALGAFERALDGDREGIDVTSVTKKRDRARELGGR